MKHLNALTLLLPLAALSSACVTPYGTATDPYSQVAPYCMTQDPLMGQYISSDPAVLGKTYLTPECVSALLQVIPYDATSWASAPVGMQNRVTEAFQAIIAYPLAVDTADTAYLGTPPPIAGGIPLVFFDIYQQAANPNQALFNYILNHTDQFVYGGANSGVVAQYEPAASAEVRTIFIYQDFYDPASYWTDQYRDAFVRASTLAHEARHGDSIVHEPCNAATTGEIDGGFSCDNELQSAYGMAGTYLKFLLHGSATCSTPGCTPALAQFNVELAGWYMCVVARNRLNNRWPSLEALVGAAAESAVGRLLRQHGGLQLDDGPRKHPAAPARRGRGNDRAPQGASPGRSARPSRPAGDRPPSVHPLRLPLSWSP